MAKPISIEVWNPSGKYRVVSTKSMPGTRWIRLLTDQDCRLEVNPPPPPPPRFVGNLLKGQTVGVIGAGRIGSAYARMMIEGFKMNLIYYDLYQATRLEKFVTGMLSSSPLFFITSP
ncbi:hypothetical protein BHM03_00022511 [Ensete ventricosum]|nr:hypothetical protein BHM03_00022511 [Ensete ventricosum]